jgi:hypothetical protein
VRPLAISSRTSKTRLLWLAAAATVVISGAALWHLQQETRRTLLVTPELRVPPKTPVQRRNLDAISLTRLALEDNESFEVLLANESRTVLPSFRGAHSTLRVLAKE